MKTGPKVSEKDSAKDNNVEKELFKNKNINTENVTHTSFNRSTTCINVSVAMQRLKARQICTLNPNTELSKFCFISLYDVPVIKMSGMTEIAYYEINK